MNTFFKQNRKYVMPEVQPGITVPGQAVNIVQALQNGQLDQVSEQQRKKMIHGKKIKIEDLSALDHFKRKLNIYENLMRTKSEQNVMKVSDADKENKVNNDVPDEDQKPNTKTKS